MSKPTGTKKKGRTAKTAKVQAKAKAPTAGAATTRNQGRKPREPKEALVVFAFRLTPKERKAIHQAAGPAKASRFVRALAVAASQGDETAVRDQGYGHGRVQPSIGALQPGADSRA